MECIYQKIKEQLSGKAKIKKHVTKKGNINRFNSADIAF